MTKVVQQQHGPSNKSRVFKSYFRTNSKYIVFDYTT